MYTLVQPGLRPEPIYRSRGNEFRVTSADYVCAQRIRAVFAPNSLNNNLFLEVVYELGTNLGFAQNQYIAHAEMNSA